MAFAAPTFDTWSMIYTSVGAAIYWGVKGRTNLRAYCLSSILDVGFGEQQGGAIRGLLEFLIFIGFGILVGVGVTHPQDPMQALVAGLGWTGLMSYHASTKATRPAKSTAPGKAPTV